MHSGKNILILCTRLDLPGGIERAIVNTANLLSANGHQITLLVLDDVADVFFHLERNVSIQNLPLQFGIHQKGNWISRKLDFLRDIRELRGLIRAISPDVAIGTEYNISIALIMAYGKNGIPLFSWEHHHFKHLQKNRFWRLLQKYFYPRLDAVICLNRDEAESFNSLGCKTVVIPNFCEQSVRSDLQAKSLLTVGWLSHVKGVDLIPAIAERVFSEFPEWRWLIIGKGPGEHSLKEQIVEKNLQAHISIQKPLTSDLSWVYLNSSVYVMTSQFECFPMVLLEAFSHGVPAVAFDCPTGPRFIITDKKDGFLVEENNVEAMADAIIELIGHEEKRKAFGAKAYESISRFAPGEVFKLWEALLNSDTKRTRE